MKSNTLFRKKKKKKKKKITKELTTHERLLMIGELLDVVTGLLNKY